MAITIRQLIKGFPVTVQDTNELALALRVMISAGVQHLPVLQGDALVGVLSERDIVRRYFDVGQFMASHEKVSRVMCARPITIGLDADLDRAIKEVATHGIGCLPVVEGGALLGIVTRRDLLATVAGSPSP